MNEFTQKLMISRAIPTPLQSPVPSEPLQQSRAVGCARRFLAGFLPAATLFLALPGLHGQTDFSWDNLSGGDFETPGNWEPTGPPGTDDTAIFELDAGARYTIDFNQNEAVNSILLRSDLLEFDLDGRTFTAGSLFVNDNANQQADLLISGGGTLQTTDALIGSSSGVGTNMFATVTLSGAGTLWNNTATANDQIIVGRRGNAEVIVTNGAAMSTEGRLRVGFNDVRLLSVLLRVTGQDSSLTAPAIDVRSSGDTAALNIEVLNGATADIGAGTTSGLNTRGDSDNMNVLVDNAELKVGGISTNSNESGKTDITVQNQGSLIVERPSGSGIRFAANAGTETIITVQSGGVFDVKEGTGGTVTMIIGDEGTAQFNVVEEGTLSMNGQTWIGNDDGSEGTLNVTGQNAYASLAGPVEVGRGQSTGLLAISDGGQIEVTSTLQVFEDSTLRIDGGLLDVQGGNALTLHGGSILDVTLRTGSFDPLITVDNQAFIADSFFELGVEQGFSAQLGEVFTLMDYGSLSGEFFGIADGSIISVGDFSNDFLISYTDNSSITLTVIPEPRSVVLLLAALALIGWGRFGRGGKLARAA